SWLRLIGLPTQRTRTDLTATQERAHPSATLHHNEPAHDVPNVATVSAQFEPYHRDQEGNKESQPCGLTRLAETRSTTLGVTHQPTRRRTQQPLLADNAALFPRCPRSTSIR